MGLIEAKRQARAILADAVLTQFQVAALDELLAAAMSDAYDEGYGHGMADESEAN